MQHQRKESKRKRKKKCLLVEWSLNIISNYYFQNYVKMSVKGAATRSVGFNWSTVITDQHEVT